MRCSLKKELACQVQAIDRNSSGTCENFVTMTGVTTERKRVAFGPDVDDFKK